MPKYYDFMICGYYLYLSWRIIKERCILLAPHIGQAEDTPFSFYLPQPQTFSPKSLHLSEEKRIFAARLAELGNLKASFHYTRWHNLC